MTAVRTTLIWFVVCLLLLPMSAAAAPGGAEPTSGYGRVQTLIDAAKPGETLELPAGTYRGPLVVDKPLHIRGMGTARIVNDASEPAVVIHADRVTLEGVEIDHNSQTGEAAILIEADETTLSRVAIRTRSHGIQLREADRGIIEHSQIAWLGAEADRDREVPLSQKGNGIDLFDSHRSRIAGNEISGMNDGIYLESSHDALVEDNKVERSRYGIHCMYTNGTKVIGNEGRFNVTGAMIMGVQDAEVTDNVFRMQSENVNSQGILLFDVQTSRIYRNVVEGNRVGLYIEQSLRNELTDNDVLRNFIGIQLLESEGNRFANNRFIANVIEAEATESMDNRLTGNYWDSFRGIDLDRDGMSDIPYAINPFFQQLVDRKPAFQLFFQSPGIRFLESLFVADQSVWAADSSPLMRLPAEADPNPGSGDSDYWWSLFFGIFLLASSIATIYLVGVKK